MSVSLKLRCSLAVATLVAFAPVATAQQQPAPADAQPADQTAAEPGVSSHIIVYGAAKDPNGPTQTVAEDETVPELPVVYEDETDSKVSAPAGAAPPASPAS